MIVTTYHCNRCTRRCNEVIKDSRKKSTTCIKCLERDEISAFLVTSNLPYVKCRECELPVFLLGYSEGLCHNCG